MIRTSSKVIAAVAMSITALVVTAAPASAIPVATINWSAATVAPGESVTLTTTGWFDPVTPANSLVECWYDGDTLAADQGPMTNEYSAFIVDYLDLASVIGGVGVFTIVAMPSGTSACPPTLASAGPVSLAHAEIHVLTSSPATPGAPAPALASTGTNPLPLLSVSALLLAVGIGAVTMRRRVAKR